MKNPLRNRLALSTVVTTLIILVISVLLASVVTYFAINVVSTRVQEESLALTKQHIWYNAELAAGAIGSSEASLMVINTGGRDVVIDKLTIRGQDAPWNDTSTSNKKTVLYAVTNAPVAADMPYFQNFSVSGTTNVTVGSANYTFQVANTALVLQSGYTMLVYIVNPDSITINDVGLTASITLYTAQVMYYKEANVQATDTTTTTPVSSGSGDSNIGTGTNGIITVSQSEVWYVSDYSQGEIALVATNTGGSNVTINDLTINSASNYGLYDAVGSFTVSGTLPFEPTGNLGGGVTVDGHLVTWTNSPMIPAGQTVILYGKIGSGQLLAGDVGQPATVTFVLASMPNITMSMLVQNAP